MADRRCNGTNQQGEPCQSPPGLIGPDGYCDAHRPGSGSAEMSKRGQRGGLAATARNRSPGLDESDLPPLDSAEAAREWAEIVGRAVATGRLGRSEGNTILKSISRWLDAEEHRQAREALEEMKRRHQLAEQGAAFRPLEGPDCRDVQSDVNDRGDGAGATVDDGNGAIPAADDKGEDPGKLHEQHEEIEGEGGG